MADATVSLMMPVEITDAVLTSTTVSEADHPAYNPSEAGYALGDRVISATTHRIYERATATATAGKDPTDINNRIADASGVIWWIDVSATNAHKMFDGESSSGTVAASPLTIVVEPGFINSLYIGGLVNVDTATITMKDAPGGAEVYSHTETLEDSLPPDYYEYGFSPHHQKKDLVLNDLPPYNLGELTVTLTNSSGNIEVGMFQIGDLRPLGTTQFNAEAIPKTYSRITVDEFGDNKITRRKSAHDIKLEATVDIDYADTAVDILKEVLDVPVVCVATTFDNYAALRVFGLVNGKMRYPYPTICKLSLDVKGLI